MLRFRKLHLAKKFMDKRRGRGSVKIFCRIFFCLTVPKVSIGESFGVSLYSAIEKVWIRGGGVSRLSVKNFMSQSAENFRRGTFCAVLQKVSGGKNVWIKGGKRIKLSLRKLFVSQCQKIW